MTHETDWSIVVERASAPWVYIVGASLLGGLFGAVVADPGLTGPSLAPGLLPALIAAIEGISIAGYRVRAAHGAHDNGRHILDVSVGQLAAVLLFASVLAVGEARIVQLVAPHTPLAARFGLLGALVAGLASWWAWRALFTVTRRT